MVGESYKTMEALMISMSLSCIIVESIIQVVMIYKLIQTEKYKYWSMFLGLTVVIFISAIAAFVIAININPSYIQTIIYVFSFSINLIILIVGLIIRSHIKPKKQKSKIALVVTLIIALLINAGTLSFFANTETLAKKTLEENKQEKVENTEENREKMIKEYLKNKYGEENFKIANSYATYHSPTTFWGSKTLEGYVYEIESDLIKYYNFTITLSPKMEIKRDAFLPVYYSQQKKYGYASYAYYGKFSELENYLMTTIKDEYSTTVSRSEIQKIWEYNNNKTDEIIPSNYGKIPTIQELIELVVQYKEKSGQVE